MGVRTSEVQGIDTRRNVEPLPDLWDVALLHSLSELLTSTAELVGVIGLLAVLAYLNAIRDRIRSGADLPGSALRVTGGTSVTGRDVLTEVIEVVPDIWER
jgi:hypothetical protein